MNYLQRPDCFNCKYYNRHPHTDQGWCKFYRIHIPSTGGSCSNYTPYKTISDEAAAEINRQIRTSKIGYSPLEALLDMQIED